VGDGQSIVTFAAPKSIGAPRMRRSIDDPDQMMQRFS
jgi:hypothetical protein